MGVNTTPFFDQSDLFGPFEPSSNFAFPPTCNPESHCSSIGPFMLGGHACVLTHTQTQQNKNSTVTPDVVPL